MTWGCEHDECQKRGKYRPNNEAWLCDDHAPQQSPSGWWAMLFFILAAAVIVSVCTLSHKSGAEAARNAMIGNGGAPLVHR